MIASARILLYGHGRMREGLLPNGATSVCRLAADERTARAVADILSEALDPEETAAAAFELPDGSNWALEVYFAHPPDEGAIRTLVAEIVGAQAAAGMVFSSLEAKDWVEASLAGLAPVRAGRFLVHGSHDRGGIRSNDIAIEIEAALAFGTGHHGTTRGCLLMLDAILKQRRPRRVMDVGTGTGVLAIAAARALQRRVVAGDIDPISTLTAGENARINAAGAHVRPVTAIGVRGAAMRSLAPYDLIFANILARPLRLMAPSLTALAGTDAELVLSGLLPRDVPGILSAYGPHGFALARRRDIEGWVTLLLRRNGAAQRPRRA
jgi:ribosomal protein L11 methyltransferase